MSPTITAAEVLQAFERCRACAQGDVHVMLVTEPGQRHSIHLQLSTKKGVREAARLRYRTDPGHGDLWILWLEVAGPLRRCGLGTAIVRASEDIARRLGMTSLHVYPLFRVTSFWRACGFRPHDHLCKALSRPLSNSSP